mmetsp:Transcript_5748/g.17009  ORF Transcript_5748/g.17009 Transcript_5748/m.17009 type:complete len:266 (-) Transcript_5748:198-995(-)
MRSCANHSWNVSRWRTQTMGKVITTVRVNFSTSRAVVGFRFRLSRHSAMRRTEDRRTMETTAVMLMTRWKISCLSREPLAACKVSKPTVSTGTQNVSSNNAQSTARTTFGMCLCRLRLGNFATTQFQCSMYWRFCSGPNIRSYIVLSNSMSHVTVKAFMMMSAASMLWDNCSAAPTARAVGTSTVRETSPQYTNTFHLRWCSSASANAACTINSMLALLKYRPSSHKHVKLTAMLGKLMPWYRLDVAPMSSESSITESDIGVPVL